MNFFYGLNLFIKNKRGAFRTPRLKMQDIKLALLQLFHLSEQYTIL